ncbi:MAG: ABC transporter substrate-binding protein [Oligoflexales bacterium]
MAKTLLLFIIFSISSIANASDKIRVTFLNPNSPKSDFWNTVTSFMKAAGEDLGMEVRVHYVHKARQHLESYLNLEKDIASNKIPNYLVMPYIRGGAGHKILELAEKSNIKTLIFNTDIPDKDRRKTGKPRGKFTNWIGHIYPDDKKAGFDLGNALIKAARQKVNVTNKGKIEVVGISGDRLSSASLLRNDGLKSAVKENGDILRQIIFANWERENARKKAKILIERHPNASVFWSASDSMSLGIIEGLKKSGKTPGKHIVTGGVDWMPSALEAIREGSLAASIGGHFMEAGWIMVMLYDYHHGKDFAKSEGLSIQSRMDIINESNVNDYLKYFKDSKWGKIDFKKLSKVLNPKVKEYDFSLKTILKQLKQ